MSGEAGKKKMILVGRHGIALFVAAQFVMSLVYVTVQYYYLGRVGDWPYVVLIFINVLLVWWTLRVQYTLLSTHEHSLSRDGFVRRLFSDRRLLLFGFICGAVSAIAPFRAVLLSTLEIKLALSALLFVHMLVIGMGIFALSMYLWEMRKVASNISLTLWNRHTEPMVVFSRSVRMLVVMVTFVVGIALGCFKFSHFQPGALINAFAICSFLILLAVYAFPFWFVNQRFRDLRAQHLGRLGDLLQAEYSRQLDHIQTDQAFSLDRLKSLRELYTSTNAVSSAFRIDLGTVRTIATMLIPTVLPYINNKQLSDMIEAIQMMLNGS